MGISMLIWRIILKIKIKAINKTTFTYNNMQGGTMVIRIKHNTADGALEISKSQYMFHR